MSYACKLQACVCLGTTFGSLHFTAVKYPTAPTVLEPVRVPGSMHLKAPNRFLEKKKTKDMRNKENKPNEKMYSGTRLEPGWRGGLNREEGREDGGESRE